jgi:transposase
MIASTRPALSVSEPTLYVAFELGKTGWKLAMTSGFGVPPVLWTVRHAEWPAVDHAIASGRQRCGLPPTAPVVSCYEAGRDGFWIHRALVARGVANRVVDSSSIEVKRRARRTKTDRLDALKLVLMLVRACAGEARVWNEVRVPSVAAEAARHQSRERTALTQEQTRLKNQIRSWLATWGCAVPRRPTADWWVTRRDWSGAPLPAEVQARLARAQARLTVVAAQIAELTAQQRQAAAVAPATSATHRLVQLKGLGATGAAIVIEEGLEWRAFQNRRQVGGLLGFAPTKYESGASSRDRGISRAGNTRLQAVMVQWAWGWLRWQPHSALAQWYHARFGQGKRARKIGIVALARKLLIALWRYVTTGVVPAGAVLRAA